MKIYKSMEELIGSTPLVELRNIEQEEKLAARLLVKVERGNPAGSVKDRVAKTMLDDAEAKGKLSKGGTVIEPTSGNTGIGIAAIGAARGYRVIIVMPDFCCLSSAAHNCGPTDGLGFGRRYPKQHQPR